MKKIVTTASTESPAHGPNWKTTLLRGFALTAAISLGATAAYLTVAPSARAAAAAPEDGGSFFQRMHGGAHSHEEMHAHFDKVLTEAGVSDAQKQQIQTILKQAMTAEHSDMQDYHASMGRMKSLLTADPIDDAAIATLRVEQDRLALSASRRLSETAVTVARVLAPAQRVRLGAEIDRMMASPGEPHHAM
jgi:P pilus assembly/Cpx signaling pathway, periplasmic inhibitor/zinc-resistance associated protein